MKASFTQTLATLVSIDWYRLADKLSFAEKLIEQEKEKQCRIKAIFTLSQQEQEELEAVLEELTN